MAVFQEIPKILVTTAETNLIEFGLIVWDTMHSEGHNYDIVRSIYALRANN
jgi:hypothetical protein